LRFQPDEREEACRLREDGQDLAAAQKVERGLRLLET
jgi:hypothetical protein